MFLFRPVQVNSWYVDSFFFFCAFCSQLNIYSAAETILLAFQNYILMLGTSVMIPTVLVPAMGGGDVSKFLINYVYFLSV